MYADDSHVKAMKCSPRRMKRLQIADEICQWLRYAIGYGGPGLEKESWNEVIELLMNRWMNLAGKEAYEKPAKRRNLSKYRDEVMKKIQANREVKP